MTKVETINFGKTLHKLCNIHIQKKENRCFVFKNYSNERGTKKKK